MPFAAMWMDPEVVTPSEVRQRQILCDTTCVWHLKNNTEELNYKTETNLDIESKLTVTKDRRGGMGIN